MPTKIPTTNKRHNIDPHLVKAQIEKKVADYERFRVDWKARAVATLAEYELAKQNGKEGRWPKVPDGGAGIDPMLDDWIAHEYSYFALVRVIELPHRGKRFILVYGDTDDTTVTTGTGPFLTLTTAKNWFLQSGR